MNKTCLLSLAAAFATSAALCESAQAAVHSAPDLGKTLEQRIERMSPEAWAFLEQNGLVGDDTIARAWGNGNGRAWGNGGRRLPTAEASATAAAASPTDTAVGLPIGEPFRLRPDRAAGDPVDVALQSRLQLLLPAGSPAQEHLRP